MKRLFLSFVLLISLVPYAFAAQLEASINYGDVVTEPSFQFFRMVYIEYPDGGEIAKLLQGKTQTISFSADSQSSDMGKIIDQINENLRSIHSPTTVKEIKIEYHAILKGDDDFAQIEYKIRFNPIITDHIFKDTSDKTTIDASWRGITLNTPLVLDTKYGQFDINNPQSAIAVFSPDLLGKIKEVSILKLPLINASEISKLPLKKWESLFDNTAILPTAKIYNFTGINVMTHYSMGVGTLPVPSNDREWIEVITLDKKYTIRAIESADDASISIMGYAESSFLGDIEIFETSLTRVENPNPTPGEFPVGIIYGMAGMAAIGGVILFVVSNRKLKNDQDQGQTGIDPSNLSSFETSESAGSYKTNRGETHIVSKDTKSAVPKYY
jgi:hypothetical protein